jgi:hypothetical protein
MVEVKPAWPVHLRLFLPAACDGAKLHEAPPCRLQLTVGCLHLLLLPLSLSLPILILSPAPPLHINLHRPPNPSSFPLHTHTISLSRACPPTAPAHGNGALSPTPAAEATSLNTSPPSRRNPCTTHTTVKDLPTQPIMATPGHHAGNTAGPDTPITIKISVNDSLKKLKLPLKDLGANVLIDKVSPFDPRDPCLHSCATHSSHR